LSKLEKLLEKIRNNPKAVRFEELDKLLIRAGFKRRQSSKGSSHYYYTKDEKMISVPFRKPYILETYVLEAIELIGDYFSKDDD
jgi:predicted RNA binding protein YcfA (HicA-like mRNA interferase family)